jgi:hypothetical protein
VGGGPCAAQLVTEEGNVRMLVAAERRSLQKRMINQFLFPYTNAKDVLRIIS